MPVERSRSEIERVLVKYGAKTFGTLSKEASVTLFFEVKGRELQWEIPLPDRKKYYNNVDHEREIRRRWRVMLITVKALLEAVESKLMTFDEAFLPHLVVPGTGRTISKMLDSPRLDAMYAGKTPLLLTPTVE